MVAPYRRQVPGAGSPLRAACAVDPALTRAATLKIINFGQVHGVPPAGATAMRTMLRTGENPCYWATMKVLEVFGAGREA